MTDNVKFNINGKLEISWSDGYYKSNIEDVQDKYISISIPIKDGQYIPLRVGEKIEVLYYANRDDVYKFIAVVIARKIDRIPVLLLGMPKDVVKVQRRRFVRVPTVYSIEYSKVDNSNASKDTASISESTIVYKKGIMVDLSGGGMRVKVNEEFKLGEQIICKLPINSEEVILRGEVMRVEKDVDKRSVCGISFKDLDEKNRDKMIRFIFQIMRDQMRKGLKGD